MTESESADISSEIVTCDVDDTTCSVCYAEFLDPEDLALHVEQVHPSAPSGILVKCQFCEKCFTDAETYVLHVRDDHLLDFKSCSVCNRIFTSNSELKRHQMKHPLSMCDGTFTCSQCGLFFMYQTELVAHELGSHYDSKEGVFLNKHYALLSSVININAETFIRSVGNDKDEKQFTYYACKCCKYRVLDLELYILHLKRNNCRSLVCDKCHKVYNKRGSLFYHVSRHPNCDVAKETSLKKKKLKTVRCSKCKGHFDSNSIKTHSCKPSIKCSHCDIEFENMYALTEHQSQVHASAVTLVMCKFCRKECVGPDSLEKHMERTHGHELHLYKYTCTYCDATFKHPQRLFAHYFRKHHDIEPYLCKICDKKFRVRKGFTLHIKLQHKSEGFVEFDERLHVFFSDKKSEKPFQPVSMHVSEKHTDDDYDSEDVETSSRSKEKETAIKIKEKETSNKSKQNETTSKNEETEASSNSKVQESTITSKELDSANINSNVNPNETVKNKNDEGMALRKRKNDIEVDDLLVLSDYDSDDEPLLIVKKKARLKSQLRKKPLKMRKRRMKNLQKQFTCEICKKYCYTFQNYQNHVNLHFRDERKKCIKCSLAFKTKADLERHMTEKHSSSRLTETLKTILERRKKGERKQEMTAAEKFLNTVKKVQFEKDNVTATLSPITKELSVQKFIEDFTPEEGESRNVNANSITITKLTEPVAKQPVIKMTKFKPSTEVIDSKIKLAMPVRFKKCNETHSITIKKVQTRHAPNKIQLTYDYDNHFQDDDNIDNDDYNCNDGTKDANIPEVEQEVTLEVAEDVPKRTPASHKIVIPKLPKELKSIRIAHLQPEAPYYKIVKMDDIMKAQPVKEPAKNDAVNNIVEDVRLPDGTKLVHVNPLAHLLGGTPVEKILGSNKYYKNKPKTKNFEAVLANALRKLETPSKQVKKKKEPKKEVSDKVDKDTNKQLNSNDTTNNDPVKDGTEAPVDTSREENATSNLDENATSNLDENATSNLDENATSNVDKTVEVI